MTDQTLDQIESACLPDEEDCSDFMQTIAAEYQWAIENKVGLPAWLAKTLDEAPRGGALPAAAELLRPLGDERDETLDRLTWDGRTPSGRYLDFAEDLAWCTLRRFYGWGLPSRESLAAVTEIAREAGGLLEIGAGTGYWSACVAAHAGVPAVAVDDWSWSSDAWNKDAAWTDILDMDGAKAAAANVDLPILMVWIAPGLIGDRVVDAMAPGRILMIAGPLNVTATKQFGGKLDRWFDVVGSAPAVNASGTADTLWILRKRASAKEDPASFFAAQSERDIFSRPQKL